MAWQGNVGVLRVQQVRGGVHLYVFKASAYDLRCNGIEGLPVCMRFGFSLHRLTNRKDHAAQKGEHDIAAQNDTCDGDGATQQRKEFSAQLAALALAQLLRQLFIRHISACFFHCFLLLPPRR